MHMADALLAPAVAGTMYVLSSAAAGTSLYKLRKEPAGGAISGARTGANLSTSDPGSLSVDTGMTKKLPTMAIMAALVFAGQMINYTIPGTGSSGHMCGGMMLTALLGPYAGFLSMIVVLAIQCLFFADGGLMALGANVWNMAFYGCFVGYFLIWRPIVRSRLFENHSKSESSGARKRIILASILGCVITLQLGAFSVVLETSLSGITELPFGAFVALMQPIHLAIGLVEGLITAAVLVFVYEARPEMLPDLADSDRASSLDGDSRAAARARLSLRGTLVVLAITAVVIGGGVSLLASSNPDGLEWALFGNEEAGYASNMALDEEDYGVASAAAERAEAIQETTSILPDYAFAGDEENPAGTSVSGLVGIALVAGVAAIIGLIGGLNRKKAQTV